MKTTPKIMINGKPVPLKPFAFVLLLLLIIPLSLFGFKQISRPPTPDEIAQKKYIQAKQQADVLSATVAKQAQVPTDETPNVATIQDVTKLQDQAFFKQAKNGDKVLIYEKKKIVVLYRPSEDRVIATAPVAYNQPTISPTVEPTTASSSAEPLNPNP